MCVTYLRKTIRPVGKELNKQFEKNNDSSVYINKQSTTSFGINFLPLERKSERARGQNPGKACEKGGGD